MTSYRGVGDIIVIPKSVSVERISMLEEKLKELGETTKVIGMLRINCGVFNPRLKDLFDGTQIILSGEIRNYHELKEFIRERYDPDANIFRATIYKYEPGDAKHFGDGLLLKS